MTYWGSMSQVTKTIYLVKSESQDWTWHECQVQIAMKDRLGVNGQVWLELKFHKVDNLFYLEGPSGRSFPLSNQGEWWYSSCQYQPDRYSYLMMSSYYFRMFFGKVESIMEVILRCLQIDHLDNNDKNNKCTVFEAEAMPCLVHFSKERCLNLKVLHAP